MKSKIVKVSGGVVAALLWFTALLPGAAAAAQPGDEVLGQWFTGGSLLHIQRNADGMLSAQIIALQDAVYGPEEKQGPVGAPRRDDNNPDAELRQRPLMGLDLLSGYEFDGKKWQGKIYDPESGKTYSSNMRATKGGILKMRGYVGVPMFGRTAEFISVQRCEPKIVALLRAAELSGCE